MRRARAIALLLVLPFAAVAEEVHGRLSLGVEGVRLGDLGPMVVFLEPDQPTEPLRAHAEIRQRNARFDPEFLVVTTGQAIAMPNDDVIFHNVFSFSRPNDFDLGMYPSGESRTVQFGHAGLVKLYCSIHESMSGAILVVPSPWFAEASASGRYRISDVPAGHYRVTVWNEKLPAVSREVTVGPGSARVDFAIGSAVAEPPASLRPGAGDPTRRSPLPAAERD